MSLSMVPGSFHGDAFHGVRLCKVGKVIPAGSVSVYMQKYIHTYPYFCR